SVTSRLGRLFLVWGLLGTAGTANTCRSHRDIVSEPARRTGQAQLVVGGEASHGQTERMYRPALLEKRTGSKDLPHGAFPSPFPKREHDQRADSVRDDTCVQHSPASLPARAGGGDLFLVDELIRKHEQGERERQHPARPGPGIVAAD